MKLETVRIASAKRDSGYVLINEQDFNPALHKIYVEGEAAPANAESQGETKPLSRMNKAELTTEAIVRGIEVQPEATNRQIVGAIESFDAAAEIE